MRFDFVFRGVAPGTLLWQGIWVFHKIFHRARVAKNAGISY